MRAIWSAFQCSRLHCNCSPSAKLVIPKDHTAHMQTSEVRDAAFRLVALPLPAYDSPTQRPTDGAESDFGAADPLCGAKSGSCLPPAFWRR
jgi:hypothetical protein